MYYPLYKKVLFTTSLLFIISTLTSCANPVTKESERPIPTAMTSPSTTHIPSPTSIPTPTPTPHPDLKNHYTTRESIEGYEKMTEEHIQELLDMYDLGYEDKEEEVYWERIEEGTYEEGYEEGYNDGYADAERDDDRDYDDRPLW